MVEETKQVAESVGVLGSLGIDGKIFLAQLVNVGVVMLVMWRWVYRPLLKVMDERTQKIEKGLRDAEESAALKQRAEQDKEQVILEARLKAKDIIEEARTAAQAQGEAMVSKAKAEVEKIVGQGREQLARSKSVMLEEAKHELGDLLVLAVAKVTDEKLDLKKDEELIKKSLAQAEIGHL